MSVKLFRYRWIIGLLVILLCVIFEIHGSSIGIYSNLLSTPNVDVFGHFRPIRSDEWWVNTPLAFSQYYNNFEITSHIVRGTTTDMTMIYAQPAFDFITIFRPFLIGYLFLSPAKGLAFFWTARWIVLFLISFDFGMLLFERKKGISLCYAISIAFAPIIQWWFAVNFIAELFIFGQLGVLLLNLFIKSDKPLKQFFCCLLLIWCCVSYALSLYPAWQVSLAYVFLGCGIWILYRNNKEIQGSKKKYFALGVVLLLSCCIVTAFLIRSYDTVKIVKQKVYPGGRFLTGVNLSITNCPKLTFNYLWGILLPKFDLVRFTNNCESARFIDFAPLGIFLVGWQWVKKKKIDFLIKLLLVILVVYFSWILFKWPFIVAKLSLLSNVTGARIVLGIGFLNLLILFRELAIHRVKIKIGFATLISLFIGGALTYICYTYYPSDKKILHYVLIFISSFAIWFVTLIDKPNVFMFLFCVILLVSGGRVNPIARGTDSIYSSSLVKKIEDVARKDGSALWLVDAKNSHLNNIPIMVGARTINSINVYPALERWETIDEDKEFLRVYNKYAHIYAKTSNSIKSKKFVDYGDAFEVTLNSKDLQVLKVRYLLSSNDKQHYGSMGLNVSELYRQNELRIYRLNY